MAGPPPPPPASSGVSSSAPAPTVPPASSLPPAVKRRYDEIVRGIAPGRTASKRKRTLYQSMNAFERLISASKHFPRGVNPFFDISLVMTYGTESNWGEGSSSFTPEELRYAAAFDKLFAVDPDLLDPMKQFYLEMAEKPDQWERLVTTMRQAATSARTSDTNGLKHKLLYFVPDPTKHVIYPPVSTHEKKTDRGLSHPMLRHFIIGYADRLKLPPLVFPTVNSPSLPTPPASSDEGSSPSPDPSPPNPILQNIVAGRYKLLYKPYSSFLYADDSYNPEVLDQGLLRGDAIPRFLRHIWLGPQYAILGAGKKISKTSNASLHNVKKVTPEMICYAVVQARTALGTSDWTVRDGEYNFEKLFNSLIKLCVADPDDAEDVWPQELLDWCQQQVFGGATIDSESEAEKSSDEEDVLAQRRRRRRAAADSDAAALPA
ncbi:hypothetical protein R3P38DRAFT_3262100 [Favolaschia claudopus]|uniref:Uncharacterized protein n=1 Tax=Favolaschia claudopus TaxID=2862362 RepID=A0AAW0CL32_9AGAR